MFLIFLLDRMKLITLLSFSNSVTLVYVTKHLVCKARSTGKVQDFCGGLGGPYSAIKGREVRCSPFPPKDSVREPKLSQRTMDLRQTEKGAFYRGQWHGEEH